MNSKVPPKVKYYIQSEKHSRPLSFGLCTLMEHQSLVDISICCGSNVLHAHKVVLAASSPLFRSELEQNPNIEQVVISMCEFTVIRSLIEFMYCGETFVDEGLVKYFLAAARLFQVKNLESLFMNYQFSDNFIVLPKPQFIAKKPRYPVFPFKNTSPSKNATYKPINCNITNLNKPQKVKRKLRMEAEHQACLKEALASSLAIANLKKEIGSAPQPPTFIIEDACSETTVQNFIPHRVDNFIMNSAEQGFVELNMNGEIIMSQSKGIGPEPATKSSIMQLTLQNREQSWTADKIKQILENEANSNVEIMFRTNDGSFVTVTDEVLQKTLQKEDSIGLQYQVINEDGEMGEIQELSLLHKNQPEITDKPLADNDCNIEFNPSPKNMKFSTDTDMEQLESIGDPILMQTDEEIPPEIKSTCLTNSFDITNFLQRETNSEDDIVFQIPENFAVGNSKFSPDIFFAELEENAEQSEKNVM